MCRVNAYVFGCVGAFQKSNQILHQRAVQVLEQSSRSTKPGVVVVVQIFEVFHHQIVEWRKGTAEWSTYGREPQLLELANLPNGSGLASGQSLIAGKS